jgi:uncharacterized protein YjbJ (UPF0337 family)
MGFIDKVTGRFKKAAGDLAGDDSLRREGVRVERKGEAKDELAREELRADEERERAADVQVESERRAQAAEARAERKADEIARLDRET